MHRHTVTVLAALLLQLSAAVAAEKPARAVLETSGTVTKKKRTPGKQDAKGDCRRLAQGGYMKFDLSGYPANAKAKTAELRVFLQSWSGNHWRWVSLISTEPAAGDIKKVFDEIEKHQPLLSGIVTLRKEHAGKWLSIRLNQKAVQTINARLAEKDAKKRWIAVSLGFE